MINSSKVRIIRLCVVLGTVSMWPAIAGATCMDSFKELKSPDGATFYMTSSSYPSMDVRRAFEQYEKIVLDEGYTVVASPNYDDKTPSMAIGRLPSPHPTAIMVDKGASTISLTAIVLKGLRANPAEERARLCALVAEFDAFQSGAGPRKTAEQRQQQERTTIPEPIQSLRMLSPEIPFDRAAAQAALEAGRSVIRGQACGHYKGSIAYAAGSKVFLYPATPYLSELTRISKRAKPSMERMVPDPAVFEARMEATANSMGEFQFSQMKPGRYLVTTQISALLGGSRDVYAGSVQGAYGSADVYRAESYTFGAENELSEYIDVRNDGDVVKVTLQPSVSANPFRRGLTGSLLGCRQLP